MLFGSHQRREVKGLVGVGQTGVMDRGFRGAFALIVQKSKPLEAASLVTARLADS
jgi:hypothetical protein